MSNSNKPKNDKKYSSLAGLAVLWRIMYGQRLKYGASVIAMVISNAAMFARPIIVGLAIDYAIGGKTINAPDWLMEAIENLGGRSFIARNMWLTAIAMCATMAISGVFNYLRGKWTAQAAESIVLQLKNRLYRRLQHLPLSYFDDHEAGDLIQRSTSDVETVRMFLAMQAAEILRCGISVAIAIPILCYMNLKMAIATLYLMPIVVVFTVVFFIKIQAKHKLASEAEGALTARLQENINGIRVVRAFARGDYECDQFGEANEKFREKSYELIKLNSYFWPVSDLLCAVQIMTTTIYGAVLVTKTSGQPGGLEIGELIAIITVANMIIWPLKQVGRILAQTGMAIVSLGRIGDILDAEVESEIAKPASLPDNPSGASGAISIKNLSFGFGEENVLHDISLEIEPASTLAIIGPSGSGKSVLINLLLRLYDYDQGEITFDGVEIRQLPRKKLRQNISAVLQEPFLYSRSLRENIVLAQNNCDEAEMLSATAAAAIHENIEKFDDGYETLVGEKGVTLSGGQRQRVTIARALLKNSPVLVLDDSLSAVDTETEDKILRALKKRRHKQTTILIAHRISTLQHADKIIVLEHGRITQSGTHEQLIKADGLYKRLWDIQKSGSSIGTTEND